MSEWRANIKERQMFSVANILVAYILAAKISVQQIFGWKILVDDKCPGGKCLWVANFQVVNVSRR